jgi:hypothetical protein
MKILLLSIFLLSTTALWAQNGSTAFNSTNQGISTFASSLQHLNENSTKQAPLVYPNPTKDKTTILIEKEFSSIHLKVVNTVGQTMLTKLEVEGQYYTFDLGDLTAGSYAILITIDGETEAVSVVKE